MDELIPLHIGLMGHIDHGKTALAKVLSERVSTAGLDAHPQSKKRGITIDLGFTMFTLKNKLVTLVDSPGHADLIRSVVAGAGIIDGAILVVAADEGPMIQTGEHIVILRTMGIEQLIVAITKIDAAPDEVVSSVMTRMKSIISEAGFQSVDYVKVSAHSGEGIDELRAALESVEPQPRQTNAPLFLPIDHAFSVKGHGTVVTGTLLGGSIKQGQTVDVHPLRKKARIRTIQTFGESRESATAGDRVGLNMPDLDHQELSRGCYLSDDKGLMSTRSVYAKLQRNVHYKGKIAPRMIASATIGMPTATSEIIPVEVQDEKLVIIEEDLNHEFDCIILLHRVLAVRPNMKVLLIRTDLPPSSMRIVATGFVERLMNSLKLHRKKKRIGRIHRIREHDTLVEGLASRKEIASSLTGATVKTGSGVIGTVRDTFGTRGVVSVQFDSTVELDDTVIYERLIEEVIKLGSRT